VKQWQIFSRFFFLLTFQPVTTARQRQRVVLDKVVTKL
jgi:hypothetical protein